MTKALGGSECSGLGMHLLLGGMGSFDNEFNRSR